MALDSQTIQGFVQSLLIHKFDNATEIPQCHKEWWELCTSTHRYVAIAAPRGHAKSTSITFSYLLASVLFREAQFVILVSDTETQASLFLGDIANELQENEDLIQLFGVKMFRKLSATDIIVEMNDGYQFRIIAKGAEQKLRGMKWRNQRPDLIVCDDLENDEIVQNKERRDKFKRWFTGALFPCTSRDGRIIIVGTILHMDSLLEGFMPILSSKFTIQEDLKTYSEKKSLWKAVKYRAHNDDFTKILWSPRFTKDRFLEIKTYWTERGMADVYSQEYLNYPIDETTAYFRRDDFLPLNLDDLEVNLQYYSAVDFAVTQNERSDYTVIATVGVTPTGDLLVVDIRRGRLDSSEIVEEMFSVHKRYKPELFIVESGAIEKAIGPFLKREMMVRSTYLNLYPMTPTKDKMSRARSIQARMRAGGIRFDMDKSWYLTLEDEMARFPRDKHDDQVDALAWIGLVLDRIVDAPTLEEEAEEEYREMLTQETAYDGRSKTCGY
jgi:predicted phage terminase large subunit-like protein